VHRRLAFRKSHQRSWWILHTQPTEARQPGFQQIPPTQLVDSSYSAYRGSAAASLSANPTKAVRGRSYENFFIPLGRTFPPLISSRPVQVEYFREISWAFQLHYHICFRTHWRREIFFDPSRIAKLSRTLDGLCELNEIHLIEKDYQPTHTQLVLSLHPRQSIADTLKKLKGRSSAALCSDFRITPPLWARGYLARSVGRVRLEAVKRYLDRQAEHHGYSKRVLPPVFRFRTAEPKPLSTAHSSFDLSHHVVLETSFRRGVFQSKIGAALVSYWLRVADHQGFAVDRATVLPDHVHLIVRITPKLSVEQVVLSLMNNGQYFVAKHFAGEFIQAKIDQLWQPSAYVGTCGELTTALLKAFLKNDKRTLVG
jgi:REP-associated tyrosine transposase